MLAIDTLHEIILIFLLIFQPPKNKNIYDILRMSYIYILCLIEKEKWLKSTANAYFHNFFGIGTAREKKKEIKKNLTDG